MLDHGLEVLRAVAVLARRACPKRHRRSVSQDPVGDARPVRFPARLDGEPGRPDHPAKAELVGARSNRDRSSRVAVGGDALGARAVLDRANGLGKGHAAAKSAFQITRDGADRDLQHSAESGSVLFDDEELRPEVDQPDRDGDDDAHEKQRESELSHGEPPLLEERPRPRDHAWSLAEASSRLRAPTSAPSTTRGGSSARQAARAGECRP